jgi:hypothetical protein
MIVQKSEGFAKVLAAMAKANMQTDNAIKNKTNGGFKTKYADLSEVIDVVKETYAAHGLAVIQSPTYEAGHVKVYCTVVSSEGEYVTFAPAEAPATKLDPQGVGSAITYLRRYSASAMAFITQDDDDGQQAAKQQAKVPKINLKQEKEAFAEITDAETLGQAWKSCVARMQAANDTEHFEELKKHVAELGAKLKGGNNAE